MFINSISLTPFSFQLFVNSNNVYIVIRNTGFYSRPMIFVAGGGFHGAKAVKMLKDRDTIVVADVNDECRAKEYVEYTVRNIDHLSRVKYGSVLVIEDAPKFFIEMIARNIIPEIVIPAIPRHFAGEVFRLFLESRGYGVKPYNGDISAALRVFKMYGVHVKDDANEGVVVASYMPFTLKCNPGCQEPPRCPVTGRTKPMPLHQLMHSAFSKVAYNTIVFASRLITEGVGGFSGHLLYNMLTELADFRGNSFSAAIATACSCHGVANLFSIERQPGAK